MYDNSMQSLMLVIILKGPELLVETVNTPALKLFGDSDQIINGNLSAISPGSPIQHLGDKLDHIYRTGVPKRIENSILNLAGEEKVFKMVMEALFDMQGNVKGISMIGFDITPQLGKIVDDGIEDVEKKTQSLAKSEELKRSEERYHKMIEEVQDYAILLLDREGTILNWNLGAEKIKGYRESEIIGKNYRIFYLEEDLHAKVPEKLINEAVATGRAMHEGWRKRKDGTVFWGSITITALHDDDRNIIGFSKVTRDLTERKVAEDKLRQYTAELEIQNSELEQFVYIASHDLQEPLRKIQTFSELILKNLDNKEILARFFVKISSSAERMSALIKSILNYSKLSNDENFVPIDLNSILAEVKTDLELLIEEKQAVITCGKLPVINGIPLQMTQLFSNLISNSLKFSDKQPMISVTSRKLTEEDSVRYPDIKPGVKYFELIFKDNGIGFEQQYAERIFTIFQRLHNPHAYAGTGIGLALCKKIVGYHQGFIDVESEPGKGAEFHIILPAPE